MPEVCGADQGKSLRRVVLPSCLVLRTTYARNPEQLVRLSWVGKNQMATSRSVYGSSRSSRSGQRVRSTISYPILQRLRSANRLFLRLKIRWGVMILRESMLLVTAGCLVGLAVAFGAGRFVKSLLYELAPTALHYE